MLNLQDVQKIYKLSKTFNKNGLIKSTKLSGRIAANNLPISIENIVTTYNLLEGDNQGLLIDKGNWISGITYFKNDVVKHNGTIWRCVAESTLEEPSDSSEDWQKMVDETDSITVEGWGHTLVFTAGSSDAVSWSSGSIILGDGTTYSINSGSTGTVSVETYIYLDVNTSTTVLQVTTTKSNCLGSGKILVAIANINSTLNKTTVFDLTGSDTVIDNGSILARSITANEIFANTLTANEINTASINLSEFSGNLDDIGDGSSYARVLATAISAGNILLSETIGSLDNISDGVSYGRINKTSISAGNIILSTVIGDLDDITDGTTYSKVLTTSISAGKIILSETDGDLDDVSDGTTYGKILLTEISAGHIKITGSDGTTTVIDGGQIQSTSIKTGDIAADAITADKIDVTNLSAINADLGIITAGSLNINSGVFEVTSAGAMTATSATITGALTAGAGSSIDGAYISNINADDITTGTLSADRIGASSITAAKLNVSTLSAITADMGTLTAGLIAISGTGVKLGQNAYNSRPGFHINSGNRWIETEASPQQIDFQVGGSNGITYTEVSGSGTVDLGSSVEMGDCTISGDITCSGSITGGTIQTSSSGSRVVLSGSSNNITFYSASGLGGSLSGGTGFISCSGTFYASGEIITDNWVETDSILEKTADTGVTIDGMTIKDGNIAESTVQVTNAEIQGGTSTVRFGHKDASPIALAQSDTGGTVLSSNTGQNVTLRAGTTVVGTISTSGVQVSSGNFISTDGSAGATGTATSANTLTIKNGIITNIA